MDVGSWQRRLPNVIYTNETLYIPIIVLLNAPISIFGTKCCNCPRFRNLGNSYVPFSLQKVRRLFNVPCWPVMATWGRDAATWNLPTSLDGWLGGWSTFIIWPYGPACAVLWKTVVKAVTWACLEKTFFRRILCLHSSDSKKLRINFYCRMVFCVFLFVCLFVFVNFACARLSRPVQVETKFS